MRRQEAFTVESIGERYQIEKCSPCRTECSKQRMSHRSFGTLISQLYTNTFTRVHSSNPMHLRDFMAKCGCSSSDEWLDLEQLDLRSGRMIITDPTLYPDGVLVRLAPGCYLIQVKVYVDEGVLCVSKIRAFSEIPTRVGNTLGEVSVDFGHVGLADDETMSRLGPIYLDEAEPIWRQLETDQLYGVLEMKVGSDALMPFVSSGYGDGRYTVRALLNNEVRVGVEIDFLEDIDL